MNIFSAQDIVKQYSNHLALNKVSINVPEGSVFGLLGPNGAGKTTLLRIVNQITAPDSGSLFFKENPLQQKHTYEIGYLPEERGLYKKMKVGEQALYLGQLKGLSKNDALKKLKFWFEKFEMQAWWNKKVEELSKGMQQKVQFICTILHEPELLIFDEPFSGFDPINANLLKEEILELKRKGSTIIFSTHNMESVEELCSHISLINQSQIVLEGEITTIRNNHKSNTYVLKYIGETEKLKSVLNGSFEILKEGRNHDYQTLTVKIDSGTRNNLLQAAISVVDVVGFDEVIPSMNDIFIQEVNSSNKNIK
jgi:ABC-2 type transport system ATP-binding protein